MLKQPICSIKHTIYNALPHENDINGGAHSDAGNITSKHLFQVTRFMRLKRTIRLSRVIAVIGVIGLIRVAKLTRVVRIIGLLVISRLLSSYE